MQLSIQQYFSALKGKKVAVLGIGVSNTPLIYMLLASGAIVTACDKRSREEFHGGIEELEQMGTTVYLGDDYLEHLQGQDMIFRTPGMRPDLPPLAQAVRAGSILTSEMEAFFQVCPCPILAVTGSDGKTTTASILAGLLEAAGYSVHLGGNIGTPLLPDVEKISPSDFAVVELSSFQLMTMDISPQIAVVTNLTPNHLDVHRSMGEYITAKENIFLYQSPHDRVILNADNAVTKMLSSDPHGKLTWFSRQIEPEGSAVFLRNDSIWVREGRMEREVLPRKDILLPGDHNVENYMAAIAAVTDFVSDEVIRSFAAAFRGVEHRIELVRTVRGVRYYNDSIASSPTRTIAGLKCFDQKVILIAGGYDKHIPYDSLGPVIVERVKRLILTGDTAPRIRAAVENAPEFESGKPVIEEYCDFYDAVKAAERAAVEGDVVILSPASASFDQFKNFVERGRCFKRIVCEL